jgi:tRNA pseudouridine38-40 synthase
VEVDQVHYRATIEYDGMDFAGFQRQAELRTVQGEVEAVLARLQGGEHVPVRGAGRTDSGVHATGQVIDFRLRWKSTEQQLQHALNAMLPGDVAIRSLAQAPEGFHPRYNALSRAYVYTLLNSPGRQPLYRRVTHHEPRPLDEAVMDRAIRMLLGEHDFAVFGRAPGAGSSTRRVLLKAAVWRSGEMVRVGLEANAFLFRMVRSLVGSLLVIGRREQPPEWVVELLAAGDRGAAAPPAPQTGLCLVAVRYPGEKESALWGRTEENKPAGVAAGQRTDDPGGNTLPFGE